MRGGISYVVDVSGMTGCSHIFRLVASAVVMAMITGMALPAVAQLCRVMEQHEAAASCCHSVPPPRGHCASDAAAEEVDDPPAHQAAMCCLDHEAVVFEAVRSEVEAHVVAGPAVRAARAFELRAVVPAVQAPAGGDGGGALGTPRLNLVYGVMLH